LLVYGKPLGLLQHCAAILDAPLTLYVNGDPFEKTPVRADFAIMLGARTRPRNPQSNPIDLDIWLTTPGLIVNGLEYENIKVIRDIADTVGAHRDSDITTIVKKLTGRPSLSGSRYNDLGMFVNSVSLVIVELGEGLLRKQNVLRSTT
jgi:hypothetical protein